MDLLLITVMALVALALIFDFTNGFHDAANSVATVVATRALPPKWAPPFAAFFNFLAYFIVGSAVASTVAKTVHEDFVGPAVIFSALFAAIVWNVVTWFVGLPSSSSHAIIGGLVGAGLGAGGLAAVSWGSVDKAALGIILSPLVALSVAVIAVFIVKGIQRILHWHDDHPVFKGAQLVSAAALSFGHGANDAQKTMGVIAALLLGAGYTTVGSDGSSIVVPEWAALASYSAIALGTMWGGWKVIETMGLKITKLHANTGVAANIGANTAIFGATQLGVPISTTHAAASSVLGAGLGARQGANWKVVGEMVTAWLLTIPATSLISFTVFELTQLSTGLAWLVLGTLVAGFAGWAIWAMANTITAKDIDAEVPKDDHLASDFQPIA